MEGKPRRERGLTKERRTKYPLGIKFSTEENSNHHKGKPGIERPSRERETDWKNCLGERGFWVCL
jgi:hypothetical protein